MVKVGQYSHSPACCCLSLLCLSWVIFPLCWLLSDWWLDAFLPMSNTIRVKVILNSSTTTTTIIGSVCDGFHGALCQSSAQTDPASTTAFQNGFLPPRPSILLSFFLFPWPFLFISREYDLSWWLRERKKEKMFTPGEKKSLTPLNVFF